MEGRKKKGRENWMEGREGKGRERKGRKRREGKGREGKGREVVKVWWINSHNPLTPNSYGIIWGAPPPP